MLADEQLDQMIEFVVEQFYSMQSVACPPLVWSVHSHYAVDVSPDTLRCAVQCHQKIRTCVGIPMEAQRVHVSPQALMESFLVLRNNTDGVRIPFIWNTGEIDHSEWADSHPETGYVPGNVAAD
jgi:hypothetical protein